MAYGDYEATLNASFSNATQYNIPVKLTVLFNEGISEAQNKELVKVFPNPAKDRVVFQVPSEFGKNTTISIFSFSGQLVGKVSNPLTSNEKNEYIWQPNGLSAGVYFYELNSSSHSCRGKITLMP